MLTIFIVYFIVVVLVRRFVKFTFEDQRPSDQTIAAFAWPVLLLVIIWKCLTGQARWTKTRKP